MSRSATADKTPLRRLSRFFGRNLRFLLGTCSHDPAYLEYIQKIGTQMIALFTMAGLVAGMQVSSKAAETQMVERPAEIRAKCIAAPAACGAAQLSESPYRLTGPVSRQYDLKMAAMRFDGHPCRLIGGLKCPSRGREVWRAGEDVKTTLRRSFGLLDD